MRRYLPFVCLLFFAIILGVPQTIFADTSPVSQKLGGLDLDRYCANLGASGGAVVTGATWSCGLNGQSISMTSACQWQYATNQTTAQQDIPDNPYSWSCYSLPQSHMRLGGLNLDGYCGSIGSGSHSGVLQNQWYCTGASEPINLGNACLWQYPHTPSEAQQDIPGNSYSWSCYASSAPSPSTSVSPTVTPDAPPPPLSGIHVTGNKIVNTQGQEVILRGVNRSGTEYMCVQGRGIFDGPSDSASITAMKAWGINAVNILVNEDCWLGINGVQPEYSGVHYQQALVDYTKLLEAQGIYPIISYHWGAPGTQLAVGQPDMPDADHATAFWQSVASTFKNDLMVVLHPQEEPHPNLGGDNDPAWQCWKNGGTCQGTSYPVVGMQSLVKTIRDSGAANIIALSGIQYANTLTQFLAYKPTDPLNNLMAVVDVYPDENPCNTTTCYNSEYLPVKSILPLLVGEFGESVNGDICGTAQSDILMNWMDQYNVGYLSWTWDTWSTACGNWSLITNYNGTPHVPNGTDYKQHLLSLGDGLHGTYFDTSTLSGPAILTRIDPAIDFNWGESVPGPGIASTNFSIQWKGFVLPTHSEQYTFYTNSDDGIRVWVNNTEIINAWNDHATQEDTGVISLQAGVKAAITVEYYQHFGESVAELQWASPSIPKQIIPQSQLFSH